MTRVTWQALHEFLDDAVELLRFIDEQCVRVPWFRASLVLMCLSPSRYLRDAPPLPPASLAVTSPQEYSTGKV